MGKLEPEANADIERRPASTAFAALLAWAVPGLGHWWIGERVRGVILFVVITTTFWAGVAVAGVRTAVTPKENGLWIAAQICAGPQALLALHWSERIRSNGDEPMSKAMWPASTIGVVYAGVAGLLNLIVIVDVLTRVEGIGSLIGARPPPQERRRVK